MNYGLNSTDLNAIYLANKKKPAAPVPQPKTILEEFPFPADIKKSTSAGPAAPAASPCASGSEPGSEPGSAAASSSASRMPSTKET